MNSIDSCSYQAEGAGRPLFPVSSVGCWPFGLFGVRCSFDGQSMAVQCSCIPDALPMSWPCSHCL
eukprot:11224829-Lingulodinium_polyedra.AAC.1